MAQELGFELVPLMKAVTGPIGTITADAFERLSGEMFGMLQAQGPFDGVFMVNHGAGVSEEHPDMEGTFATRLREIVGPAVKVAACLDMHANISHSLVGALDICTVWRTCPHVDTRERARHTARLLHRTMAGEIDPVMWLEKPPLVVSIVKQYTGMEPMLGLVADCVKASGRDGILDTSVVEGYPYADVDHMGMSWIAIADKKVVASGDNAEAIARSAAQWMAGRAWARREEMSAGGAGVEQSLKEALDRYRGPKLPDETEGGGGPRGPIVVMDVGASTPRPQLGAFIVIS
jgi:microcystin degradation protein MlrC